VHSAADRADPQRAAAVRAALARDDDYATLGKPPCDWDGPHAREALIDGLVATPWPRWQSKTTTNCPLHWPRPPKRWL
jgi:hypothetical protein